MSNDSRNIVTSVGMECVKDSQVLCIRESRSSKPKSNFEVELTFVFGVSIPETRNLRNSNENPREKVNQKEEHFPSVIPPVFPPVFPAFSCILSSRVKNEDAWSGHGAVRT